MEQGYYGLLLSHGEKHAISRHHLCFPLSVGDVKSGRVHTLDIDCRCEPTFVADMSSREATAAVPKRRYHWAVTMHTPYAVWLSAPRGGARRCRWRLRQQFFRNVHGWLRGGGELRLEFPSGALGMLAPKEMCAGKNPPGKRTERSLRLASEIAAGKISSFAIAPNHSKLFDVKDVGAGWCTLVKVSGCA